MRFHSKAVIRRINDNRAVLRNRRRSIGSEKLENLNNQPLPNPLTSCSQRFPGNRSNYVHTVWGTRTRREKRSCCTTTACPRLSVHEWHAWNTCRTSTEIPFRFRRTNATTTGFIRVTLWVRRNSSREHSPSARVHARGAKRAVIYNARTLNGPGGFRKG